MSEELSLEQLSERVRQFVEERNWSQFHSPRNLAMALNIEASELLELYLWCKDEGPQPMTESRKARVAGEVGDILMCLLNFCRAAQINPLEALSEKLRVAEAKYPVERVSGRALKYNEYPDWEKGDAE